MFVLCYVTDFANEKARLENDRRLRTMAAALKLCVPFAATISGMASRIGNRTKSGSDGAARYGVNISVLPRFVCEAYFHHTV